MMPQRNSEMVKPINVILILSGLGVVSSLLLGAAWLIWRDSALLRIAGILFDVAFGIACVPLIGALIYLAVLRFRRR
jgi:hypothetical protein